MKNILLTFLMFLSTQALCQDDFSLEGIYYDDYLYFLPNSDDLITVVKKHMYSKKTDSSYYENIVVLLSKKNGNVLREIPLSTNDKGIFAFTISHDGQSFVLISSSSHSWYLNSEPFIFKKYNGPFTIKKFLIAENRWAWEREWDEEICLRIAYCADNSQLICVTSEAISTIDSYSGSLIKKSNLISNLIDGEAKYPRFAISKKGRFFAYWKAKYLTYSSGDDGGFLTLGDFLWYGLKWFLNFGSIPQYLYVWDIYNNKLYDKIPIPYESNRGTPVFSEDEKELFLGPFHGKYQVYSIKEKKIIGEFVQQESIYRYPATNFSERNIIGASDYKTISSDNKYIAACFEYNRIYIIDSHNGKLLRKFVNSAHGDGAMAFSSDSKYFALVTDDNEMVMYDTQTWKILWVKIL